MINRCEKRKTSITQIFRLTTACSGQQVAFRWRISSDGLNTNKLLTSRMTLHASNTFSIISMTRGTDIGSGRWRGILRAPRRLISWKCSTTPSVRRWNCSFSSFVVLTGVNMRLIVFWNVQPCSLVNTWSGFGGICCIRLQDRWDAHCCEVRGVGLSESFYMSTKSCDNGCQGIVTFSYHVTAQVRVKVTNSTAVFVKPFAGNIVEANVHFLLEKYF